MLGWTTFNLTRKVRTIRNLDRGLCTTRIQDTQEVLEEIDAKGNFEADDEIGVVFTAIKETVDELNEITEKEL